ncbi:hypothetical protein [Thermocatellispora tengchongensis]|uniref:hypothetical protein n=1 Tax=Thermocatellispora tengchongensis TaxID=1073253 RepID=UPI0036454CBF
MWLHPGPALLGWPESRPDYFAVTRSKTPPATWADVLGVIAPARRRGRQVKSRWSAGAHFTPSRYGAHPRHTHDALTSRTAAATWVVQHAAEPANGGS